MIPNIFRRKSLAVSIVLLLSGIVSSFNAAAQNEALYAAYTTNPLVQRIIRLDKTVRDKGAVVGFLTAQHLDKLPIGIMDPSGKVLICIDSAKFTPNGGTFNAYAAVQLPGMKEKLCFRATNIPFGPNGITATDGPALTLVSTHVLTLGKKVDLVLPGNGNNNIKWNCSGFQELNVEGKFVFKRGFFIPDSTETNDSTVTATLSLQHVVNINNMLASVSITPFKIRGMEDFAFKVTDATVDMSDYANPQNFQFPAAYQNEFGSNINLWRGFFLRTLTVRTPFNKAGGNASLIAENMLIDENGVTGLVGGTNLFDITQGSADGWAFSMDTLKVEVLRNRLTGGSMSGGMRIPFLGNDSLSYRATVSQWNDDLDYLFQVKLRQTDTFHMPMGIKATLREGSYVQIEKYQGKLVPSALLNGSVYSDSGMVKFRGLRFENVGLSTQSPFIHSGTFAIGDAISTPSLAGFEVTIDSIRLSLVNGQVQLGANVALGFMEDTARGFGAHASFIYKGHFAQDSIAVKRQYFVSDGLHIGEIGIMVHFGSFELDGTIALYRDDPTYGNGFKGSIGIKFKCMGDNINLAAQAYFGKSQGYKYFQVSGFAQISTAGIPVIPGVLYLNGLLGGLSYHMTKPQNLKSPYLLDGSGNALGSPDTWARQVYVPDGNVGFGMMVGTTFYAANKKLVSGGVAVEVELNTNWGINYVNLKGTVAVMKDITAGTIAKAVNDGSAAQATPIYAELNVMYDRPNRVFHANLTSYLNMAAFKGAGPNNRFGEMVIHLSPTTWYFYIGRPTSPLGAKITLDWAHVEDLATVSAYFMVGNQLDPFPAPPSQITQNINYTPSVNVSALQSGGGVAFGAKLNAAFGFGMEPESTSWIYAGIYAGIGGDIMFSTSNNLTCTGDAVGIGGWWARGRLYAYLEGGIGIRVKIFGKRRKFDIVHLAAGALLEAKIPKPSYFDGYAYLNWNILGGFVKGHLNLHMQFGKICPEYPVIENLAEGLDQSRDITLKVIGGVSPAPGSNSVDVYGVQAITTNMPLNQSFGQLNEAGEEVLYKVEPYNVRLQRGSTIINANQVYGQDYKSLTIVPYQRLLPETDYVVSASFKYFKKLASGAWTPVLDDQNQQVKEDTVFTFRTAVPSNYINFSKIEYAYPFNGMRNFYKNEYSAGGYLKVTDDVDMNLALYAGTPGVSSFSYKMKFTCMNPGNTDKFYSEFNRSGHELTFPIPSGIENGKTYRLSMVRINNLVSGDSNNIAGTFNNNQQTAGQQNLGDSTQGFMDSTVNNVIPTEVTRKEAEMFGMNFRCSNYSTFAAKLASFTHFDNIQDVATGGVILIGERKNPSDEIFDGFEVRTLTDSTLHDDGEPTSITLSPSYRSNYPMLTVEGVGGNNWVDSVIIPMVYPNFTTATSDEVKLKGMANPDTIPLYTNLIPWKKVELEQNDYSVNYTGHDPYAQLNNGIAPTGTTKFMIKYNVPYYASRDFMHMYNAGVLLWATLSPLVQQNSRFFNALVQTGGIFPQIVNGTYHVQLTYRTPGGKHSVSYLTDVIY